MSRRISIRSARAFLAAFAAASLAACRGSQSMLDPASPEARALATLGWVLVAGGALVFLLVLAAITIAVALPPERRRWLASNRTVLVGGIAFPIVTLTVLLVWGLSLTGTYAHGGHRPSALKVEVVGRQWWWEVTYLDQQERPVAKAANEIRLPVGQPVEFILRSPDVIHSFWIPALGGKLDLVPGRENRLVLEADRAGTYRGQCAEYCGLQHARMALYAIAMPETAFVDWLAAETGPAADPVGPGPARGRELFLSVGCGSCHTIRGTEAGGTLGPDLTHIGNRRSIAAGSFPNNAGTLAGWIADAQHLKPGVAMPSFETLSGEELRAIAEYLASLE